MENFTPVAGLIGGLMIGASASLLLLFNGRIAGISGILSGAIAPFPSDRGWRLAFVAGLILGPLLVVVFRQDTLDITLQGSLPVLLVAGFLVGFGTRLGNGCTSGHGVCGLARGSGRSLAATATFFSVALLTVFIIRHVIGG